MTCSTDITILEHIQYDNMSYLRFAYTDSDGDAIDITGFSFECRIAYATGTLVVPGTIIDATNGIFEFQWRGTRASGGLTAVAKTSLSDGDNFTISDGDNPAVTFYFDVTGTYTPPGGVEIDISQTTDADGVATLMRSEINSASSLNIIADGSTTAVDLKNDVPGTDGNVTITESVTTTLNPTGMSGGIDSDLHTAGQFPIQVGIFNASGALKQINEMALLIKPRI